MAFCHCSLQSPDRVEVKMSKQDKGNGQHESPRSRLEGSFVFNLLAVLLVSLVTSTSSSAMQTVPRDPAADKPKAMVQEVVGILDHDLSAPVDSAWKQKRAQVLASSPQSTEEAERLVSSLLQLVQDPNTRLVTPSDLEALQNEMARKSASTGITDLAVHRGSPEGELVMVTPIAGSPAARAGLRPGDVITSVGGDATAPMSRSEVMRHLRGEAGSVVDVGLRRGQQIITVKLRREINSTPTVSSSVLAKGGRKYGYVAINEFSQATGEQAQAAVKNLLQEQMAGLVLDLRRNPGGFLDAAAQVDGIFSDEKLLCSIVRRDGQVEPKELEGPKLTGLSLIVLVDEGTASAAEVLAAALQDDHRATIVGRKTFGQGFVYSVRPLEDGSALLVASGTLQRPNDRSLNAGGVTPDVAVDFPDDSVVRGTADDPQLAKALSLLPSVKSTGTVQP